MFGKTFYFSYRNWKVVNYDDTSGKFICKAGTDIRYFTKEDIELCLLLNE
jgi:hypothetical protein